MTVFIILWFIIVSLTVFLTGRGKDGVDQLIYGHFIIFYQKLQFSKFLH